MRFENQHERRTKRANNDLLVPPDRGTQCDVRKTSMTNYPYILFNKSPRQLRLIGARGGRAYGRNQRARRALLARMPAPPATVAVCAAPGPTAAEAVAMLDAQFPWLRAAEKRLSRNRPSRG